MNATCQRLRVVVHRERPSDPSPCLDNFDIVGVFRWVNRAAWSLIVVEGELVATVLDEDNNTKVSFEREIFQRLLLGIDSDSAGTLPTRVLAFLRTCQRRSGNNHKTKTLSTVSALGLPAFLLFVGNKCFVSRYDHWQ